MLSSSSPSFQPSTHCVRFSKSNHDSFLPYPHRSTSDACDSIHSLLPSAPLTPDIFFNCSQESPLSPCPSPTSLFECKVSQNFFPQHTTVYPSPPPTDSQLGQNIPLPTPCGASPPIQLPELPPRHSEGSFGGVLDSPLVMRIEPSKCQGPLSPPPTLPKQTLSLPPTDYEIARGLQPSEYRSIGPNGFCSSPASSTKSGDEICHPEPLSISWSMDRAEGSLPISFSSNPFFVDPVPHFSAEGTEDLSNCHSSNYSDVHAALSKYCFFTTPNHPHSPPYHFPYEDQDFDPMICDVHPIKFGGLSRHAHYVKDCSPGPFFTPTSPLISSPSSSENEFEPSDSDDGCMSPISAPASPSLRTFSELPVIDDDDSNIVDLDYGDGCLMQFSNLDDDSWTQPSALLPPTAPEIGIKNADDSRAPTIRSFPGVDTDDDLIPVELASRSWAPERCLVIPATAYITPTSLEFPHLKDARLFLDHSVAGINRNSSLLLLHEDKLNGIPTGSSWIDAELDQLDPELIKRELELKGLLDMRRRSLAVERKARMIEAQYENIKNFSYRDIESSLEAGECMHGEDFSNASLEAEGERDARLQTQQDEARMQSEAMQAKRTRRGARERVKEIGALVKIRLRERGILPCNKSSSHVDIVGKDEEMEVEDPFPANDPYAQDLEMVVTGGNNHWGSKAKSSKCTFTTMPQLVAHMILRRHEARLRPLTKARSLFSGKKLTPLDGCNIPLGHNTYYGDYKRSPLAMNSVDVTEGDLSMPCGHNKDILLDCKHHSQAHSASGSQMDVDECQIDELLIGDLDDLELNST
ncbi:hypothetical protein AMATHDRAFT_54685 [Amanita thiersii Skay4041]|uniref:Uncharacterized protein n=1 Tax=Amanita thiersii Skay4041 TaxID=703135 RepID=A0A2A9NRC3_9AGAR|nr:hypothetical protein AMATHDRAFT_54685 [Amanita thiersii Skay4041]